MAPEGQPPTSDALEVRVTQLEAQVMRLAEALTQLRRDLGQRVAYLGFFAQPPKKVYSRDLECELLRDWSLCQGLNDR